MPEDMISLEIADSPSKNMVKFPCDACGGRTERVENPLSYGSDPHALKIDFSALGLGTFTLCLWCMMHGLLQAFGLEPKEEK